MPNYIASSFTNLQILASWRLLVRSALTKYKTLSVAYIKDAHKDNYLIRSDS